MAERGNNPAGVAATEVIRAYYSTLFSPRITEFTAVVLRQGFVSSVVARLSFATLCVTIGDRDQAYEQYRNLPPVEQAEAREWYRLVVLSQYAQVGAYFDDKAICSAAYDRLLPFAELHVVNGTTVALTGGSAHYYLGLAAAALDRVDTAVDHFRSAIASNSAAGLVPRVAESRLRLAQALLARGEREEAMTQAKEANAIAGRLGMARLLARATELIACVSSDWRV